MISISSGLKEGWQHFKSRPGYLFVVALAVAVLYLSSMAGEALFTALAAVLSVGYLSVLLNHVRGNPFSFDDIFVVDKRWVYFAFLFIIKALFILLGLILFIVPGVYLAVKWMFAELLVIDQGLRPMEALRKSSEMTKGHRWKLFAFSVIAIMLSVLGLILFIVGSAVAFLVTTFALITFYEKLKEQK